MNILTFDIEEWFHILDNDATRSSDEWGKFPSRVERSVDDLLQVLAENEVRATFFLLGWVAERKPGMVRAIAEAGHDIGTHSYEHQLIYQQTNREFEEDLKRSLGIIGDIAGRQVDKYRAPGFSLINGCEWVFPVLYQNGIRIDASVFPAARAHGGYSGKIPAQPCCLQFDGGELLEFPMNTATVAGREIVFSGGGYFRLLPLVAIRHFMRRSDYVMTYFHPRDFDIGQPVVPGLDSARKFKSYVGIAKARRKLDKLLKVFDWCCIDDAVSTLENLDHFEQLEIVRLN